MNLKKLLKKVRHISLQGMAILSISFVLGEIALRTYQYFNPTFIFYESSHNRFRGKPFADDWNFKLNSKGFKDKEFTKKESDIYRIVGIGDSFAFGVVPYEHNYLTLLESNLQEEDIKAEVLNLGIPGIGPKDYLTLFAKEGLALNPDMLVVSLFIGNDFTDIPARKLKSYSYVVSLLSYITTLSSKYEGQIVHPPGHYCDDCPTFHEEAFLKIEGERSFLYIEGNQRFQTLPQKAAYYLSQIDAICQKNGIDLVVILIPDELQVNPQLQKEVLEKFYPNIEESAWNTRLPNKKLTDELKKLNIDHIDLYEYFAEKPAEQLYKLRDTHWNIAGNSLAANIIQDYLLKHYADRMK